MQLHNIYKIKLIFISLKNTNGCLKEKIKKMYVLVSI